MERRLTAILAADVAGYSRHTERNEEASTATLSVYRVVVEESIAAHRVTSSAVRGTASSPSSPVSSRPFAAPSRSRTRSECATHPCPRTERMQFRIGMNLGDVIAEDNNLLWDRGECCCSVRTLAEPGGICISQTVFDQVRKIVEIPFQDIGERRLKNIAEPVHVYRVLPSPLPWLRVPEFFRARGASRA